MKLPSVMIVDDDESDRYLLRRLLMKAEVSDTVFEAADGQEALDFLSAREEGERLHPGTFPPLLVFVDVNMPRLNGFDFLERFAEVRLELGYESVVLMVFSSSNREQDRLRSLGYAFVKGLIVKMPRSADELKRSLIASGLPL